jgi:thiol-disulfide isomerase/thioredoxin
MAPWRIARSGTQVSVCVVPKKKKGDERRREVLSGANISYFFNGVKVGTQLPAHEFVYLGPAPVIENRLQLIDFWATWCAPCRVSIPRLNELQARFAPRGLVIIGLTKEPRTAVEPFLEKIPMNYASALDGDSKLYTALKIKGLPYAIFADKTGKIVWRGQPDAITDQLIESLLAQQ